MLHCQSTNPSCTIQGLDCGGVYNFSVKASDGACNSSLSHPVLGQAGTRFLKTTFSLCSHLQSETQQIHLSVFVSTLPSRWCRGAAAADADGGPGDAL